MGLSGLGQQLSDLIGGLIGTSADTAPELSEFDPPDLDEAEGFNDKRDDAPDDDETAKDPDDEEAEPVGATVESETEPHDQTEVPADVPAELPPPPAATEVPTEPVPPIPPAGLEASTLGWPRRGCGCSPG